MPVKGGRAGGYASGMPENESHDVTDAVAENGAGEDGAGEDVAEVPLNRAARRGKGKEKLQKPQPPGHVGPQALHGRGGHTPRSHTKRRSV